MIYASLFSVDNVRRMTTEPFCHLIWALSDVLFAGECAIKYVTDVRCFAVYGVFYSHGKFGRVTFYIGGSRDKFTVVGANFHRK